MNRIITITTLIICFFIPRTVFSQQGNNWYFGDTAGITFNTNPPSRLLDGKLFSDEAASVISDSVGNLLFYSDSKRVFNRLHQVMSNGSGILGGISASQGALIIKQPGNNSLYYLFTASQDEDSLRYGYRYSIIDMTLNGGLGDVTAQKNILLYTRGTERLTAAPHANGSDVWIITRSDKVDTFKVFLLTCNGINPNPVLSQVGAPTNATPGVKAECVGSLRSSRDGTKVAMTRFRTPFGWELYKFNNATGVLSDAIYVIAGTQTNYGVEFSPDSKLLYFTWFANCCPSRGYVVQYKVDVHDSATIANSAYIADSSMPRKSIPLIGPDGRIYVGRHNDSALDVITSPNTYGPGCNYLLRNINLGWKRECGWTLPNIYCNNLINRNADFTFSAAADCRTITFTAFSALNSVSSWHWDFGDGTTGSGQTVTHTYPNSSNVFSVILTVTNNSSGCPITATRNQILNLQRSVPDAKFGFLTQCNNKTATFRDSSTVGNGSIIAWHWDFGDGQTSTVQHPSHTYTNYGPYNVQLIVTSADGCNSQDTITHTIYINPKPVSYFPDIRGCVNSLIQFTDQSSVTGGTVTQWQWNFGDGQSSTSQNPQHNYAATNTYLVTLITTAANGCKSDTLKKTIRITEKPSAQFGFLPGCAGSSIIFSDSSSIISDSIRFWFWDFGNGDSSITQNGSTIYNVPNNYWVEHVAISNGNCPSDTIKKQITIESKPTGFFSAYPSCGNLNVQFKDSSAPSYGAVTAWRWDFGDGQTSNQQHPTHTYNSYGSYIVKFNAYTNNNCVSDTVYKTITVKSKPLVDFVLPSVCLLDASADFLNQTTNADNSSLAYKWYFGDFNAVPVGSDTSHTVNGQHHYSAAALYNVKLIATSSLGCIDSISKSFTVNGAIPKAGFSILNSNALCSNKQVSIKDSSTVDFGNITKLKIFWGDGDSTIDVSPQQFPNGKTYSHLYPLFGTPAQQTYTIYLYAYSGTICVNALPKTITLNASPKIQFTAIPETCHETSAFVLTQASEIWGLAGSGSYSGIGITNSTLGIFDPALADTGNHIIYYSFLANNGCSAADSNIIRVNPTPKSVFSFNNACLPAAQIQFNSQSSDPYYPNSQLYHQWYFDDANASVANPNSSTLINPDHIYTSLDTFRVLLTVISPKGCMKDTTIKIVPDVNVFPQPIANFKLDSSIFRCEGTPVSFINISDSMGRNIIRWLWNFGDGSFDSVKRTPSHLYIGSGVFNAGLIIENEKGCKSAITAHPVSIESIPKALFEFDTACFGKPIQFRSQSTNTTGNIVKWYWDFDDGTFDTMQHPIHIFNQYGNYDVSLIVSTLNGCQSTPYTETIPINRVVVYAGKDTLVAPGQSLQLQASGAASYIWSPGLYLSNPNAPNPVANLSFSYTYYLQGTTNQGCIGLDTINITVIKGPQIYVPSAFTPNKDRLNDKLKPVIPGVYEIMEFSIYNRWGKQVFRTNRINEGWDGTISGVEQPAGSYIWFIRAKDYNGKILEAKGIAVLIR